MMSIHRKDLVDTTRELVALTQLYIWQEYGLPRQKTNKLSIAKELPVQKPTKESLLQPAAPPTKLSKPTSTKPTEPVAPKREARSDASLPRSLTPYLYALPRPFRTQEVLPLNDIKEKLQRLKPGLSYHPLDEQALLQKKESWQAYYPSFLLVSHATSPELANLCKMIVQAISEKITLAKLYDSPNAQTQAEIVAISAAQCHSVCVIARAPDQQQMANYFLNSTPYFQLIDKEHNSTAHDPLSLKGMLHHMPLFELVLSAQDTQDIELKKRLWRSLQLILRKFSLTGV
jgi:hypothetical protein